MKTWQLFGKQWLAACCALVITACGGGGGGDDQGGDGDGGGDTGGIDRGGIVVSGTITGFSSVHVNGVHYTTTGASFTIDDQPGLESDLRVGQVVTLNATLDTGGTTGTATRVVFDDEVEGPIQSINLATGRLVVLGRTIVVTAATSFDDSIVPRGLEGLTVGTRVEVSGLVASDGSVGATRIELKPNQATSEVKGTVANLDTNAQRFTLGALTVSYATAQLANFPNGQPAVGDRVEAVGSLDAGGVLVATRLERESGLSGNTDDRSDVEGLVTRFVSVTDFSVAGQRVTTTASTVYEGGSASSLALNVPVEVEGRFDAAGTIVASKVEFRRGSDTEVEGTVEAVNATSGTLVVLGRTFRVNSLTRFEDHSASDEQRFDLADIVVGDFVEIDAYSDGSGFVATKIERDDASDDVQLEGVAQNVAAPNLTVAGVAVTTDATTEFRDDDSGTIDAAAFFQAAPGRLVRIRGTLVGNVVLADRAELED